MLEVGVGRRGPDPLDRPSGSAPGTSRDVASSHDIRVMELNTVNVVYTIVTLFVYEI